MNNGYSKSQKGKVVLVKDYYTYQENYIYKETTSGSHCRVRVYWKCAMAGCKGTARTYRTTELEDSDFSNGQNHSLPFHDHKEPKELFKVWDADVKVNGDKAQATMNQYPVVNTEKKLHAEIHELIANQVNQPAKMEIDMDGLSQCSELPDEFFSSTDDIVEGGVKRKREEDLEGHNERLQRELSYYKEKSKVALQQMVALWASDGGRVEVKKEVKSSPSSSSSFSSSSTSSSSSSTSSSSSCFPSAAQQAMEDLRLTLEQMAGRSRQQVSRKFRVAVKKIIAAKRFSSVLKLKSSDKLKTAEVTFMDEGDYDEADLDSLIFELVDLLDGVPKDEKQ